MIAIICPVHRNPHAVAAQIRNYASVHGNSAFHILHPSIESKDTFAGFTSKHILNSDVILCKDRFQTSYYTALGAVISATEIINSNHSNVTHVYYHSDADLLVESGFNDTILKHNNGFLSRQAGERWYPYRAMLRDTRFQGVRDHFSIDEPDIRIGRHEGSFFEIELWREMLLVVSKFFGKEALSDTSCHWPFEACIFASVANKLLDGAAPSTSNLVLTKNHRHSEKGKNIRDIEANMLQVEDIISARKRNRQNRCFGMKWFSTDLDHPARNFVKETLENGG
ncbi:MAG: hypothetical protein L3J33_09580 [Rhodobacteraceae bacterium]|nr:hypothetical protein [Paracoccaceae bacterium]